MQADYDSDDDGPQLTLLGHVIVYVVLAVLLFVAIAAAASVGVTWPDWGVWP